ncbi:DnaJ subfamily C member 10 [Gossypium australe]|uniref:DnaJ subfamily C member 10 n=1 Tax=Gossypium australe TaxID=47621 RepID=A0A5B6VP59_9ROSI|nr:DnaJ subfamily C member 10 [Gossypium australe]
MPHIPFWLRTWVRADDAVSNMPAPAQGTAPVDSRPESLGQGEEAREAFLHMMRN